MRPAALRVEQLLRERPEIGDVDLGKIIVVAGLQRTGTTTLHRVIGADFHTAKPITVNAAVPRKRGGDPVCAAYRSGSSAVAVTRRFRCLPSSVALSAIGCDSPWAFTLSRSGATPAPTRWSRTASTRRSERRWL